MLLIDEVFHVLKNVMSMLGFDNFKSSSHKISKSISIRLKVVHVYRFCKNFYMFF